ncbi:MAG: M48 family metallopeptidase [Thiobacillus sp.]|nr:M48 family metallopeptidase [Thiobacillus sp.]
MRAALALLLLFMAGSPLSAQAFDLGKLLEERINQELEKRDKSRQQQSAPAQAAPAQPAPAGAQSAAASPPPARQKVDAAQIGFALFGDYSLEEENRIGRQIAGNLLGAARLVPDAALQRYVNEVGQWVAQHSGRPELSWRFGVLDSDAINAFAAPGGYIFVTRGLYRLLNSEAELAGVLGHEIAHVTQKHHLKLLKQSSLIGALGQAASNKVKDSDPAIQNLIGNGAEIMARGLDKEAEFEADRIGMVYAARAGYDPWGLPNVLQDMAALPAKDSRTSLLYKTHPHPADRLSALGAAVGDRMDNVRGKELSGRFYRLP